MPQVLPETLPKYKRPNAFANRDFPPGCGPNAVRPPKNPTEEAFSPVGLHSANETHASTVCDRTIAAFSVPKKKGLDAFVSVGALQPMRIDLTNRNIYVTPETNPENVKVQELVRALQPMRIDLTSRNIYVTPENNPEKLKVQELVRESSQLPILLKYCYSSKMYGPPKRRKISADREFPSECGPNSSNINKHAANHFKKNPILKQTETVRCSRLVPYTKHILRPKNMPLVKQSIVMDKPAEVTDAENHKKVAISERGMVVHRNGSTVAKEKEKNIGESVLAQSNSNKKRYGSGTQNPICRVRIKSSMYGFSTVIVRSISEKALDGCTPDKGKSLEEYGERMISRSLLSAEKYSCKDLNKFDEVGSTSIFPKIKIKKKGLVERKSQQDKKNLINDIDHIQEKDRSQRALSAFQKPKKVSVTKTPFAPSRLCLKSSDSVEIFARHRVKRALRIFQSACRKLLHLKRPDKLFRVDLEATKMLKRYGEWLSNGQPIIGHVPGVEIGDEFHYRVELSLIGLHRPFQNGIAVSKQNGIPVAASVVASGGYEDDVDCSDVLIYSGSGGKKAAGGDKQPGDQKLVRGNLALKNCIDAQTPVRVIHGFKEKDDPHDSKGKLVSTFTYAGLYYVESYWQERGPHGFKVFKFQLKRKAGQPELAFKELKRSKMLQFREGLCANDISRGKEKIPISVVNTVDNDRPRPFKYIAKNIYPAYFVRKPPVGCGCIDSCSDSKKCACALKNGGEIPYNFSGSIVQAKPLVYECGPSCKCPPSCHNRVSQHGIRIALEVFKTKDRGWGVRSLKSISSGSFICGYIGELLQEGEAEQRINDEYLFDIGHNYDDLSLWGNLPNLIPELQSRSSCDGVEDAGFTIDAAEYGNVGRFVNHSCSPNLYAQNVLYDHDDKKMPHVMFFAVDNIPPLQELTYHYNYAIDQVRDSEGNAKKKACHCGSPECRGRLY